VHQFEGRIEKPISVTSIIALSVTSVLIMIVLLGKAWTLQAKDGEIYTRMSENNAVDQTMIFPDRGAIYDRNNIKLAWNKVLGANNDFSLRNYIEKPGFSHVLGYLKYPSKDKQGFYFRTEFEGMAGIEKFYNNKLQGKQGLKILERDALGNVKSESVIRKAVDGENLILAIDSELEAKMYE
jgi:penicillin-binding protein 2